MAAAASSAATLVPQSNNQNNNNNNPYLDFDFNLSGTLDISPHSIFSDADFLLSSASDDSSSLSTPALFPDLDFSPNPDLSTAFPPVDTSFSDLVHPSLFAGDPAEAGFDQLQFTTAAGFPSITAPTDQIDWTALGLSCEELGKPVNSLESQNQGSTPVDSPDPPFDPHKNTFTILPSTSEPTSQNTATTTKPVPISIKPATMSSRSLPTPSPAPTSRDPSPKETPSRITKRELNTMAARRYRQRRLDRMMQLEEELEAVKRERDELKMRVSKLEGETDALRRMVNKERGAK
ncbi:hypothetical protein BDV18DRAFT_162167 [Aspergillus unguis]